jgi:hypothetical protein
MTMKLNNIVVVYDHAAEWRIDFWTFGKEAYHATVSEYDLGSTVGSGATGLSSTL